MPSIDSLPYDVLCLVFSQFQAEDRAQIKHVHPRQRVRGLAAWAATSRKWQEIAERRIWNQMIIRSVHSLEELARCTTGSSSQRACYVRRIYWWPYIDNTVCSCLPESDLCHQERRVSFLCKTAWLDFTQRMLEVLHSWGDSHPGVELVLYSNNGDIPQSRVLAIPVEERRVGQRGSSVPIKLTKENLLGSRHPPCVNKFQVLDTGNECVGLGTVFEIMRCFPSLKDVCGEGYLMPPKPLEQRDQRITNIPKIPKPVDKFTYKIAPSREAMLNGTEDAPRYVSSAGIDSFSVVARNLSMRLRELHLESVRISSALFWPSANEDANNLPKLSWPRLEVLHVLRVPPFKADGKRLLLDGHAELQYSYRHRDNQGNIYPNSELDALYEAMGLAAQKMPQLRSLRFSIGRQPHFHNILVLTREMGLDSCLEIDAQRRYELGDNVLKAWRLDGPDVERFRHSRRTIIALWSLSSIFYLVPLYFLVIAPLLRQLNPSQQQQQHQQQLSFLDDASYDDNADEDPIHTLNPDVLSLDDGTPISCPPDSESYRIHLLSRTPLVIYVESFLSPSEADHLTNISLPNYTPSILYSSSTDKEIDTTKRLSDRALLPRDNTVRCIEARAKAFQGWKPHLYIERMWAQRYNVSGHYTHHYDWAGTAKGRGGDRFSTFMVYLGDECKGGGTHFPFLRRPRDRKWCEFIECEGTSGNEDGKGEGEGKGMVKDGVTFRPIKGNAVFWENLKPDGSGWEETWHAAEPVTEGEKVGLNIWSWYQPPRRRG